MIDPKEFEKNFIIWVGDFRDNLPMDKEQYIIPIDEKNICNSKDDYASKKTVHMVSAMADYILGSKGNQCNQKYNALLILKAKGLSPLLYKSIKKNDPENQSQVI